jgi:hypothetical protein
MPQGDREGLDIGSPTAADQPLRPIGGGVHGTDQDALRHRRGDETRGMAPRAGAAAAAPGVLCHRPTHRPGQTQPPRATEKDSAGLGCGAETVSAASAASAACMVPNKTEKRCVCLRRTRTGDRPAAAHRGGHCRRHRCAASAPRDVNIAWITKGLRLPEFKYPRRRFASNAISR